MNRPYPRADGALLAAVQAAMAIVGNHDAGLRARRDADKALIALCPHPIDGVMKATGFAFNGRHFKLESIEVGYEPHFAATGGRQWYWIFRGPLILKTGKISRINSVTSFETFHVELPSISAIPGDAGY